MATVEMMIEKLQDKRFERLRDRVRLYLIETVNLLMMRETKKLSIKRPFYATYKWF